jgi:hypothetical protein
MGTVKEVSGGHVAFRAGSVMTLVIALSPGALTTWVARWDERQREVWRPEREKDL